MASELVVTPAYRHTMQRLEDVKRTTSEGDEYWSAREVGPILGYEIWQGFEAVIARAEASITANGGEPSHHIGHTTKLMGVGKTAKRRVAEAFPSRGACYLIAMNGDPAKPEVAAAQAYFAVQTRNAELAEREPKDRHRLALRERVTSAFKRVSDVAHDAGVKRFPLFHAARYHGLYKASRKDVEHRKGVADGENIFDRAGALELAAHEFQMQLAATKIVEESISGEREAINANLSVARQVRQTVIDQSRVRLEDVKLEVEPIKSVKKRLSNATRPKAVSKREP